MYPLQQHTSLCVTVRGTAGERVCLEVEVGGSLVGRVHEGVCDGVLSPPQNHLSNISSILH